MKLTAIILVVLLSSCSHGRAGRFWRSGDISDYIAAHPELTLEQQDAIRSGGLWLGMTPEEVRLAIGRPNQINRTLVKGGTPSIQWTYYRVREYGGNRYVYIENDRVIAIQD